MSAGDLAADIWRTLDALKDPCMQAAGLDISLVGLGIVKDVAVDANTARVTMALTEPGCGFTHVLVTQIEDAVQPLVGERALSVTFDWSEGWTDDRMRDDARDAFAHARARSSPMLARMGVRERQTA